MKPIFLIGILFLGLSLTACKEKTQTDANTEVTGTDETSTSDGTFVIDPQTSIVKWKGSKPTGVHNGTVPVASGTVTVANGNITAGTVEINMQGITVNDLDGDNKATLESHLKGSTPGKEEDFFNVDKYPKATYVINSASVLENDPDGTHMLNGTLTIKDISKPVSFKAKVNVDGNKLTATTPEFPVDRTEYDIRFKSRKFFNNLQDDFVNDEFLLQIEVSASKS